MPRLDVLSIPIATFALCVCTAVCAQRFEERFVQAMEEGDYERAIAMHQPMAESGDPEFQFAVGYLLLEWFLDPKPKAPATHSYQDALRWIYRAIDEGIPQAAGTVRSGYEWGRYSLPKNEELEQCWRNVEEQRGPENRRTASALCDALETKLGVGRAGLDAARQ